MEYLGAAPVEVGDGQRLATPVARCPLDLGHADDNGVPELTRHIIDASRLLASADTAHCEMSPTL
jgi:hypothetical protein